MTTPALDQEASLARAIAEGYIPGCATATPEEFLELLALLRSPPERVRPLSADDEWRISYREQMQRRRIMGYQADLFGKQVTTHYNRHAPGPKVQFRPRETVAEILARVAVDPFAPYGLPRPDRPTFPTQEERNAIISRAANWLHVRQRVRLIDADLSIDPENFGNERYIGRAGVIWQCGSTYKDNAYVFLDPIGRERAEKIIYVEVRDLAPIFE